MNSRQEQGGARLLAAQSVLAGSGLRLAAGALDGLPARVQEYQRLQHTANASPHLKKHVMQHVLPSPIKGPHINATPPWCREQFLGCACACRGAANRHARHSSVGDGASQVNSCRVCMRVQEGLREPTCSRKWRRAEASCSCSRSRRGLLRYFTVSCTSSAMLPPPPALPVLLAASATGCEAN